MIRSILVPLEGTRFGERAVPVATALARSAHARVCLVTAQAEPSEARNALAGEYLSSWADWIGTSGLDPVEWRVEAGEPGRALAECVSHQGPDLVVMATHGCGTGTPGPRSVAQELAARITVPLLLLPPPPGREPSPAAISFRRVLVPVDLARGAPDPLGVLLDFTAVTQAHLTLLHVLTPDAAAGGSPAAVGHEEPATAPAQRELDQLASRLRERGASVATTVVTAEDPARAILAQWDAGRYDAAVLTVRERGCGSGTVVDKVIRGASRPILLVHAAPEPAASPA